MSRPGYTLVLCEKPDAARKVADALAEGRVTSNMVDGIETLRFERGGADFVVCSAIGHLYRISDPFSGRDVFPVFDLEWYPANLIDKKARGVQRRIASIRSLAKNASSFINACDYDAEGETIGENILRYACGGKESVALRAKFSTLARDDVSSSFDRARTGIGRGLGCSGRTRHALDFIWGINLSRALSVAVNTVSPGYKTISMGRVQGPTLAFVVQREIEIQEFVPNPYWNVTGLFEKADVRFSASSSKGRFSVKLDAESVRNACLGKNGVVSEVVKSVFREPPPAPFNTGEMQKESYKAFRYSPSKTLQLAQRLYLDALISYPRTSSEKLPPSIGYRSILSKLSAMSEYSGPAQELLERGASLSPREGKKTDLAHPAIYPTGERPRRQLSFPERRIFDLIVRRFISCFGEDAVLERTSIRIDVEGNEFGLSGITTLKRGWLKYHGRHASRENRTVPNLLQGDVLRVVAVDCEEKLESGPLRFNQSSLLERMEKEGIGTKATRAETISTLMARGYIAPAAAVASESRGYSLAATDLGIAVVETMQEYCPEVISVELTRETEKELDAIEEGRDDGTDVIERAITSLSKQIERLKSSEAEIGGEIGQAATRRFAPEIAGSCPVCKTGNLVVIRSRKTKKRFIGCTNYRSGCRASAPLPQRGWIKVTAQRCSKCGWPVVCVGQGRFPWKLCVNTGCPGKSGFRYAVQTLQKTS